MARGTEECFQKMPLEFVGQQGFVWGGGAETCFTGTYVRCSCVVLSLYTVTSSEGTVPPGSSWAMNPLPRNDTANTGAR